MGERGPAPKPTAIRQWEGNLGKRPYNPHEPKPAAKAPPCPKHLDELARKEWRRLAPMLMQLHVLTEADQIALGDLCQSYSSMVQGQESLTKSGLLVKIGNGAVIPNPLIWVVNRYREHTLKLLREFGLTPASRSRIRMESDVLTFGRSGMDSIEAALCRAPMMSERQKPATNELPVPPPQ